MKRAFLLTLATIALIGAAPAAKNWQQRTLASAAPFIDKANDEWTRAIVSGDADILSAPYAANGIFIGPDGTEIRGRDGVRTMYARRPANAKVLKASIKSDGRAAHDADDVYEWGTALITLRRNGSVQQSSGRYLTVWHRSGARWMISHNIAF